MTRRAPARFVLTLTDVIPALAAAALGVASIHASDESVAYEFSDPSVLQLGLAVAATLPLAFRRTRPMTMFLVILGAATTLGLLRSPTGLLPGVLAFALGWVAYRVDLRRAAVALVALSLAFGVLLLARAPYFDSPLAWLTTVAFGACWVLGLSLRLWRSGQTRAVETAESGRRRAEEQARLAREDERRRLARELHDSVTNSLAAIVVQAGVAAVAADPQTRQRWETLAQEGRTALAELRRLLLLLREGAADPAALTSGAGARAQLAELLAAHRRLGGEVVADIDPGVESWPPGLAFAMGRVVGELLANGRRYGSGPVRLQISRAQGHSDVVAENLVATRPTVDGVRTGFGLLGVSERVAALGGSVRHQRRGDTFEVRLEVPDDGRPT